jgi:hypothetical protein
LCNPRLFFKELLSIAHFITASFVDFYLSKFVILQLLSTAIASSDTLQLLGKALLIYRYPPFIKM